MEHSEKLLDNDAQYPGSAADDSKTGTSEDVDGAGGMRSQEGINKSQNTPLQNNTCHDKNDASETGTLLNSTVPEESGDQAGGTTSPIDKSGGARDNFADTGRTKCVCGENGTYFDGTHDDVVSYNFSSGDQNYDDAEPRDVLPDDVKSRGPDYENEKSGELKSDGTEPTAVVSSDAVSDEAEPSDVKSSSNETDGVSMGHVKACDDTGDRAVPSSNTGNDDNRQNEISTDTGSGEQTPSDRKEEGQRDEYSEKEFDASDSTEEDSLNLRFYRNEIYSKPFPGEKIDDMLQWKGDYLRLERSHSYIQWLFPIPEGRGMNYSAQELLEHEAKTIREDETLRARVLEAFKMMLDFYGMQLVDDKTGEVRRADNWQERYEHLDRSVHNRFRITRILKALGELGFEHLQEPWLEFIMHEATVNHALPSLNGNCMVHWIDAIKDDNKHDKLFFLLIELKEQLQKQCQGSEEKKDDKNHVGIKEPESSGEMQNDGKQKGEDKNVSDDDRHTKGETTPEKCSKVEDHETKNKFETRQVENLARNKEADSDGGMQDNVKEIGAHKKVSDENRHTEGKTTTEKSSETDDHHVKQVDVALAGKKEADSDKRMQDNVKEIGAHKNVYNDNRHNEGEATAQHVNAKKDKKESWKPSDVVPEISGEQANFRPLNNPSGEDNVKIDASHLSKGTTGCKSTEGISEIGQHGNGDLNGKADNETKNENDSNENVDRNIYNPAELKNEQSSEVWTPSNIAVDNNTENSNEDYLEEDGERKKLETTV